MSGINIADAAAIDDDSLRFSYLCPKKGRRVTCPFYLVELCLEKVTLGCQIHPSLQSALGGQVKGYVQLPFGRPPHLLHLPQSLPLVTSEQPILQSHPQSF